MSNRTAATNFFGKEGVFLELDRLKFAAASLVHTLPAGSYEQENANNAVRGIERRIDYLHDSLRLLLETKA